jgi:molybdopterin-containing oxidoreductase family iron-sulfur binding subunit
VFWEEALRRGGVFGSSSTGSPTTGSPTTGSPTTGSPSTGSPSAQAPAFTLGDALGRHRFQADLSPPKFGSVLHAFPSIALYDGRGANKGWLQELPDPVTKVVWGSWVEAHPETARELACADGEWVRVTGAHGAIEAPLRVHRSIAPRVLAVVIGQGHARYGRNAAGRGANPLGLLDPPWAVERPTAVTAARLDRRGDLVVTARDFDPGDRHIAQTVGLGEVEAAGAGGREEPILLPLPESYDPGSDILPPHRHRDHRWAMAIDLNSCTGCSACVTACYAENNIPVVGKDDVAEGREMAWITLQRYDLPATGDSAGRGDAGDSRHPVAHGAPERTTHVFIPMLCQHCDAAPCEPVCPVFASYHTEEGLNGQVYNRCIGTRYCANNCPYQVRRFNWHSYRFPDPLHLQLNPDVTVRDRGVMEKCTFCVQRIMGGKQRAGREGRPLADREIEPACAQTCPARAIVFGDLLDPQSEVSRLTRSGSRRYQVLGELRTRPAVTYLKKVRTDLV